MLFLTGCSQKLPEGMPKLYPTKLTLTQENTPLAGAVVQIFANDPSLAKWGASGVTDTNGVVELKVNAKYKGVPAGTYKVTVAKKEIEPHPHPEWGNLPDGDPKFHQYRAESMKLKSYDFVEMKFGSLNTTPLEIEVKTGSNNISLGVGGPIRLEAKRVL
jgi:hypothetical protein